MDHSSSLHRPHFLISFVSRCLTICRPNTTPAYVASHCIENAEEMRKFPLLRECRKRDRRRDCPRAAAGQRNGQKKTQHPCECWVAGGEGSAWADQLLISQALNGSGGGSGF